MTKKLILLIIAKFSSLLALLTVLYPLYGYLNKPIYCSSVYKASTYYCNSDIVAVITILFSLIIIAISWKWHRTGGIILILSTIAVVTAINQEFGVPNYLVMYIPLAIISAISFLTFGFKSHPLNPLELMQLAKIIFIILNILFLISVGQLLINGPGFFGTGVWAAMPGFIGFLIIDPIVIKMFKNNNKKNTEDL